MKTSKLLVLSLFLFLGTSALFANDTGKTPNEKISVEITDLLKNSDISIDEETKALVSFVVNENNEIVVLNVSSNNYLVKQYIKTRLNYKKLITKAKAGEKYYVPVRFKS